MTIIQQMCPAHQVLPHPWPWSAIVSTYSPIDFEHWHHCTVLFITIASTRDRQICYGHYICGHIYSNRTETKLLSYEMLRSYKPLKVLPAMDSTFNQSYPCAIQPSIDPSLMDPTFDCSNPQSRGHGWQFFQKILKIPVTNAFWNLFPG